MKFPNCVNAHVSTHFMKTTIIILTLFISIQLFGQNTKQDSIDTACLKELRIYLDKIYKQESDKSIDSKDSLLKYKVVFTSQGQFIDPKNHLMRLCNVKNLKKESFFAEVVYLENKTDSLYNYFRSNSCETIKTCIINNLWGEPLADSIVNIHSEPSFWASCISAKEVKFSQDISISGSLNSINKQNTFATPSIISYQAGKYLIVDIMLVLQIGNQTNSGEIVTFYLERID